jgi:hypothetical protein
VLVLEAMARGTVEKKGKTRANGGECRMDTAVSLCSVSRRAGGEHVDVGGEADEHRWYCAGWGMGDPLALVAPPKTTKLPT